MNITVKRVLGATAAVTMAATALIGAGAGTAGADDDSPHCDRAERGMWNGRAGVDVYGHGCSGLPDDHHGWSIVKIDTLVETYYKTEYLDGGVDHKATVHDSTVRCLGYLRDGDTVRWFGCVPG